jgi:16S rRNA (adenine1518-N6/adenine1519-N6)-dimethyltransferase
MRPKKKFGQHFLTSVAYVEKIVQLARIGKGDRVLEIGPGKGALTRHLVSVGAAVTAVEFDPDMVEYIQTHYPSVQVIHADASTVNWAELLEGDGWKVASNLPYNVGTRIVKSLLQSRHIFDLITVMLQKEVGVRMIADTGDRKRGSLSSYIQAHAIVKKGFIVPPGAFFPPPRVDSIVISLRPRELSLYSPLSEKLFDEVNRAVFCAPRKAIRNSLKTKLTKEEVMTLEEEADFPFTLRAFHLDNSQIVQLAKILEEIR